MTPLQALGPDDVALIRRLIGQHPTFEVYLADGLAAAARGMTNRLARIGRDRRGVALAIVFDTREARTLIGEISPAEELALADVSGPLELHLKEDVADRIGRTAGSRPLLRQRLCYYRAEGRPTRPADARCRPLLPQDLKTVSAFYAAHYPQTVFSRWMLEQPFVGLFQESGLLACGGVHALADGIANLGNFLTAPEARGQGLAQAVAVSLMQHLSDAGFDRFTLGTTQENAAACRTYEAVGFRCFDRRVQLNLGPA